MHKSEDVATLFNKNLSEGIELTKEGKFDLAIEKLSKALQLQPNSILVHSHLAGIYEIKKEFAQSITYYKQVVQLQPNNGIAYARLAKVMMAQKNIQGAIAVYQQAVSLNLKLPSWGYAGLGNALHQTGQLDKAIAAYQKAIQLKSDNPYFYIELSQLYYKQGQKVALSIRDEKVKVNLNEGDKLKEKTFQKALEIKPDLLSVEHRIEDTFLSQEKETEAMQSAQKAIELNPNSISALSKLAKIYKNKKEYDKAFTYYLKIVSLRPQKLIFLQHLVRVSLDYSQLLLKKNDLNKAIAAYQEFFTQKPSKNKKTKDRIDIICNILGEVILKLSIRQGQGTKAISFFQEAINNYPHPEWSYLYLGSILAKQNKLDKAITCYEKALAIRPKFPLGLLSLGKLLLKTKHHDQAFQCGLKILENHGIFGGSELNKSLIELLSVHSNPKKSKAALQKAIERIEISDSKPSLKATTYSNIGMMLRNQGELKEAMDLYQKSIYHRLQESKPEFIERYWEQGRLQEPDFLVLGFAKCGTTAFYDYLCQHPFILPAVKKEPMYLYRGLVKLKDFEARDWSLPSLEKDFYLAHFAPRPKGSHFITGEASTTNIFSGCENVIYRWFPNIKLIVLLREPVRRTISYYEYVLKSGGQNSSLEKVINSQLKELQEITDPAEIIPERLKKKAWEEPVAMSLYVYFLERWMKLFPKEQFLILTNEELAQYPAETMNQAFEFLELPECNSIEYHPRNVGSYPQADAKLLSRLSEFFQPHNQRLEEFLGRKFDWDDH